MCNFPAQKTSVVWLHTRKWNYGSLRLWQSETEYSGALNCEDRAKLIAVSNNKFRFTILFNCNNFRNSKKMAILECKNNMWNCVTINGKLDKWIKVHRLTNYKK